MSKTQDAEHLRKLSELLEHMDLDNSASREKIHHRLIHKMETGSIAAQNLKKDGVFMKKSKWRTGIVVACSVVTLGGAFSATSYAQEMFKSIVAQFQVGNMKITQYDEEVPASPADSTTSETAGNESGVIELPTPPDLTVQEARAVLDINFPAPASLLDYKFVSCTIQGDSMIGVNYAKGEETVNFLISKGGDNGISTAGAVTTEIINGTKVYHANGIVIWEQKGFTVELYSQKDFDSAVLGTIIDSFTVGPPLKQEEIDKAKKKVESSDTSSVAAPAPAH
ncbi:hypothetical protein JI735_03235 [Paenibacillus sonchi]|uniref:DUF4367 domain-containing protein n=1 Tax=Paenibacillus sonchi TaxID=373687 RepID=A0A974PD27_9BACL|nr:hypothetical protein [Paenibacillus sonchi]QQZ61772.1 hypothetical protein JI735_03235 [Paenibacillus sonchi]